MGGSSSSNMSKQEESSHRVTLNGKVVAESAKCVMTDGNVYFPPDGINREYFSLHEGYHTTCGWKGTCDYYNAKVGDVTAKDAAWVYEDPKPGAAYLKGYWAFYQRNGLKVT